MKKKADWEMRLRNYIESNIDRPFKWGKYDCCLFANESIKAMTGEGLIPNDLKWKDKASALKAIKEYGGTLEKSINKACKKKKIKTIGKNYITTGDLVVFKEDNQLAGISDGFNILAPGENGIAVKRDAEILKAWRINV